MRPVLPYTKARQRLQKKIKLLTNYPYQYINAKILKKMPAKPNPAVLIRMLHYNQVEFIPQMLGWSNIWEFIHHINRIKDKNPMIIPIDKEIVESHNHARVPGQVPGRGQVEPGKHSSKKKTFAPPWERRERRWLSLKAGSWGRGLSGVPQ